MPVPHPHLQHLGINQVEIGGTSSVLLPPHSCCSEWQVYEVAANVPSAPSPPTLAEATVDSLSLCWEQPEVCQVPMACRGSRWVTRPLPTSPFQSQGAPVSSYTLQMEDPGSGYGFQAIYQGDETQYTCSGLKRVTQYLFRVAAVNAKGTGLFSAPATYCTRPDRPGRLGGSHMYLAVYIQCIILYLHVHVLILYGVCTFCTCFKVHFSPVHVDD